MNATDIVELEWSYLLSFLPDLASLESSALELGALKRRRRIKDPATLLRLALVYGFCGLSLRQTAVWAEAADVAHVSDVALLKRFRSCSSWLAALLGQMLSSRAEALPHDAARYTLRLLDATSVSKPGSKGTDWRIHLGYNPKRLAIDHLDLTDNKGGETLSRFRVQSPHDLFIGDRGYARTRGLCSVISQGGFFIVRLNWMNVPMVTPSGKEFELFEFLRQLPEAQPAEIDLMLAGSGAEDLHNPIVRLVAIRKTEAAAEAARRKILQDASKKQKRVEARTLEAAAYVFVVTNVPGRDLSAEDVLALYRFRWQIELVFKRLKSLMHLDELPAKDPELSRTFLYAKLIAALLLDDYTARYLSFSPWGYPFQASALPMAHSAGAA